eukprot:gene1859-1000_t
MKQQVKLDKDTILSTLNFFCQCIECIIPMLFIIGGIFLYRGGNDDTTKILIEIIYIISGASVIETYLVLNDDFNHYITEAPFMIPKIFQIVVFSGYFLNLSGPFLLFVLGVILVTNQIVVWILGIASILLGISFLLFKAIIIPLSCVTPKSGFYYIKLFKKDEYNRLKESYHTADPAIYKREWLRTDWEQIY